MDAHTVSQMVTVALAVLAIIWHQQRSTDKLRDKLDASDREHRAGLGEVKERLARIEGFLGIGMRQAVGQDPDPLAGEMEIRPRKMRPLADAGAAEPSLREFGDRDTRVRLFAHIQQLASVDLGDPEVMRGAQREWPQQ